MKVIAKIKTDFPEKFGIPRQSGLNNELLGTVIFEKEYRIKEALRGIEDFSHLWLIWGFSENERDSWSPTVRPPRLGGNKRMGVFATRSSFRPNSIGLSSVRLLSVEDTKEYGLVLKVSGADLMDGTPIYDIKPYLSYTDSHPEATMGFAGDVLSYELKVDFPKELEGKIAEDKIKALYEILKSDPRPGYKEASDRIYSFEFASYHIDFSVEDGTLKVKNIKITKED